jgi:hypothetical protein
MSSLGGSCSSSSSSSEQYFHGFERSETFERLFQRLETLETWRELAIRPTLKDCDPEDQDLLTHEFDDVNELKHRCYQTRLKMNAVLPPVEIIPKWDKYLLPRQSTIPEAGIGLFYEGSETIPEGTIICYYTGHLLDFRMSRTLQDTSYLMMVKGETFVDARTCLDVKARYINDPLNETAINCTFVPMNYRSAVVTARTVQPGEELFATYGDYYWAQRQALGTSLKPSIPL